MLTEIKEKFWGKRPDKGMPLWLTGEPIYATQVQFKTRGKYKSGWPRGAVIHYTAGSSSSAAVSEAVKNGYSYFVLGSDGGLVQGAPLDRWGSHAGESSWPGLGSYVSQYLVGIEVVCPGLLKQVPSGDLYTWYGKYVSKSAARQDALGRWFYGFTKDQENKLRTLLFTLKVINPDVFDFDLVLGHHEVSPGRKEDPGASIAVGMPGLRQELKQLWGYDGTGSL